MAYRGTFRGIYTVLLDHQDFQALSPKARHVFLTIRLCGQNNAACLFRLYPAVVAVQTGYPVAGVEAALRELEAGRWIEREGSVVWIRNGLRYDPTLSMGRSDRHMTHLRRAIAAFGPLPIVARWCDYYQIGWPFDSPPIAYRKPIEGVSSHCPPNPISESESESESETDKDGDYSCRRPVESLAKSGSVAGLNGHGHATWPSVAALVSLYNAETPDECPEVTKLSPGRRLKAKQYLVAFPEEAWWRALFQRVRHSAFLRGLRPSPGHTGFVCTFDWLLTKGKDGTENCVKVAEGKYDG